MNEEAKSTVPPYTTYKTFKNFINSLRENGMPSHIGRSILPGSNSGKAMLASSLRALGLIDENNNPIGKMPQLVDSEEEYQTILHDILIDSYDFLRDDSFDLENTTTEKVVERFKALGASGSTVSKCVQFFLLAAKDANIPVSSYVKAPAPARSATNKGAKRNKPPKNDSDNSGKANREKPLDQNTLVIPVPLHGMPDGKIHFPANLDADDWTYAVKMAKFILDNYRPSKE